MSSRNKVELINNCCPVFDPQKWDDKIFDWDKKPFIMATVPAVNHVSDQSKLQEAIVSMMQLATEANKLNTNMLESLMLFLDSSPSQSNIYLSVTGKVSNAKNVTLSGEFRSIVQQGSYETVGYMIYQMQADLANPKIAVKNIYAHYAYFPQCSASVGHNYTVRFAEVNKSSEEAPKQMELNG